MDSIDGIQPTHLLSGKCDLFHNVEPGVGFEPTWAFADGLQNRSNHRYGTLAILLHLLDVTNDSTRKHALHNLTSGIYISCLNYNLLKHLTR